jgi:hypothetical protein
MKNITFSAEEKVIEEARRKAARENTNLNSLVRTWLREYVGDTDRAEQYRRLQKELAYARSGKRFSRDEMNAR